MRRLIAILFLAVATLAQAAPSADDLAARLNQRLEQKPVLRAEFVQEKQMAAFKKPLVTRGRLVFVRGLGVLWKIESPLKLTYVLTDDRIVEIGEDGNAQSRTAQDLPGLAQVGRVFRALLGAQTGVLKDIFAISGDGSADAWRLALTPKPGPVGQYMRQIQLAGGRHVDRIRIEEANGDSTTITFRNTAEDDAPSAEERARFGSR
ncbi:MAG: LolA family protein [Actinomycetota bacterium]